MSSGKEIVERDVRWVETLTKATMNWFPVRVWRRVLNYNGLLLSAGVSYQALFATFAALYVALLVFGAWFVADTARLDNLIEIINTYIPGLIGDAGAVTRDQLVTLAQHNLSGFGWGEVIAIAILLWTASNWITYSRMSIRAVFGLPKDPHAYLLLKAKDMLTSIVLGALLLSGAVLTTASTNLFNWFTHVFGFTGWSFITSLLIRIGGLAVVFVLDAGVLAVMFVTLSGAILRYRQVFSGAALGGIALIALQVLGSFVLGAGTKNPLLATFVVFVTLLFWFRLTAVVMLTAASWTAESVAHHGAEVESRQKKPSRWANVLG